VNKLQNIHAQYRYFDMEILAGDDDTVVEVVCQPASIYFRFITDIIPRANLGANSNLISEKFIGIRDYIMNTNVWYPY